MERVPDNALSGALARARLYGILDLGYVTSADADRTADAMITGGVEVIQLRAKNLPAQELEPLGRTLAARCAEAGIPFIVNDHPELAGAVGAAGVHVGQEDLPVAEARRLFGRKGIVGKSTHSLAQAEAAQAENPDYIGFGPLFATPTKPDYSPVGLDAIGEIHRRVALPIFCIGGIKRENLDAVLAAGARRVVIVSGILRADDIADYCRAVTSKLPPL